MVEVVLDLSEDDRDDEEDEVPEDDEALLRFIGGLAAPSGWPLLSLLAPGGAGRPVGGVAEDGCPLLWPVAAGLSVLLLGLLLSSSAASRAAVSSADRVDDGVRNLISRLTLPSPPITCRYRGR